MPRSSTGTSLSPDRHNWPTMSHDTTIAELKRMKAQRSRERALRDLEERHLLDNLADTDRELRGTPTQGRLTHRDRLRLSHDRDVREAQIQYERDRENFLYPEPKRDYRRRKDEPVTFDLRADPKVKQLAENHGRSMEAIQNRNRDLERQREEIRRRLEDLGRRPVKDEGMGDLLAELKEQEARNRQLLEDLRRQISNQHSVPPPAPVRNNNFAFPVYYGNSLTAEIATTRQGYLANGGSDPDVLQQLAQMQAEAQAIDDNLKNQRPAPRQRDNKQSDHLLTLELENERLQRQLLLIQEQNLQSTHRRKGEREDELERDLRRMQQDHLRKMNDLQREMEKLRHESYWRASEKPSKIIVQSTHSPPPPPVAQYIEVDRLAPYDYSPAQPYAHTWAKTHYRQDVHHDPYYDLMLA